MALDTRDKRASALGIDLKWLHVYPNPDGAISQLDRQQIAGKYSGIAAAGGSTASTAVTTDFIIYARRHGRR